MLIDRSENETSELLREWLQRYGLIVVAAVALLIAGVWGYQHYQTRQLQQAQAQSALIDQLTQAVYAKDPKKSETIWAQLTPNTDLYALGSLLMARVYYPQNPEKTKTFLAKAALAKDPFISATATWQSAQIAIAQNDPKTAKNLLQSLKGSIYSAQVPVLTGIAEQRAGDLAEAAAVYRRAAERANNPILAHQADNVALSAQVAQ